MRDITDQERTYVRSLNALALTSTQIHYLLELMVDLNPLCRPIPTSRRGKQVAATTYVRLMQGDPVQSATWDPRTWREGHAR